MHIVDLEEFKYGGTNITAFRLVDPDRADVIKVMRDWAYGSETRFGRKQEGTTSLTRVFLLGMHRCPLCDSFVLES
jgi:glutamate receptor, ionotropic, invertebrate